MARRIQPPTPTNYMVEMQGFNVLSEHFMALAALADDFFPQLLNVVGDIGVEHAQDLVPKDTWATHDSIDKGRGVIHFGKGNWYLEFGPETFYSPFLEYGTWKMAPRPFMIPAGDLAEKALIRSVQAFLKLMDTNTGGAGLIGGDPISNRVMGDRRIRGSVGGVRTLLYSSAKFLGDVSVFGGREIFGPARAMMHSLAGTLGDVNSVMSGALSTRINTRLRGRAIGRISGYGVASFASGSTYSAFPGGAGGRRVYSRVVGRAGTLGFSGLNFGRFG